jgi:hypothetical protein
MMRVRNKLLGAALCVAALAAPAARGQQQQQTGQQQTPDQSAPPIPAYKSPLAGATDNGEADDSGTQQLAPDTRALSGAQDLSLGTPTTRSYWQPHFDVFTSLDSNAGEAANTTAWSTWTSLTAGVDIHHVSGNSDLSATFNSGGMISNNGSASNGIVEELSFADRISFHRSVISFLDQLNYLPESSLGFGGVGQTTLPGGTSGGLGPGFAPGQSLLTGRGQNLGNSFVTEVDTSLTSRTSLTFVGGYSLLHYFDDNLLNYGDASFRAGYNYQLNRKDTIAVFYTFSGYRYSNINQSINTNTFQVSYARRATGRLTFQIAAGPQVVFSRTPISAVGVTADGGTGGGSGSPTTSSTTQLYWSLTTALQYQSGRNLLGLAYDHGVGGGSGVLAGSVADTVTGSLNRQVSRTFSSGITGGYSRNQGISIGNVTPVSQTYDYWFGGGSFTHPVGRSLGLTLSYQVQYQTSNLAFCTTTGTPCGTSVIRNLISFGVGWHERPLLF